MKNPRSSSPAQVIALSLGLAIALIAASFLCAPAHAQTPTAVALPIVGDWEGTLDPGAQPKKRIVVHITAATDGTLGGAIDYPDQDTSGIQMTAITYKEPALHFESTPSVTVYDGVMSKDNTTLSGTLKVSGAALNLVLKKTP